MASFEHIDNQGFAVFGKNLGADRDLDGDGISRTTGAVTAHAMHADFGLEMLLIAEINQGIEVFDRLKNDIAATPAVTTIGTAKLNIFFTPKAYRASTAAATAHINLGLVEKLHNRSFGQRPFCICDPGAQKRLRFDGKINSILHKTREE